jgi:hypothetical protein
LSSESVTEWDEDAGIIRFRNVRDAQLDDVRLRVARLISGSLSVP